ncbi:TetR/AcrR family transcriptional regulator [Micromonospora tarapacensis]|uniref:TetR/AcrR family transcriptional regulator n=1 Tax=Micromonospora tarapacensis TaxID=2835305 RepID=UPI001E578C52|nr:TetR/AcrR family transcriptional regulator [Micromonospora tarapacensis]
MSGPRRRRRADAERSSAVVLRAAIDLLARRPQASMEDIAAAAGVARQTVYAHYSSRDRLLTAVVEHVMADVMAVFDSLDLDRGSPVDSLRRWLDAAWRVLARYPILLTDAVVAPPADEYRRHLRITGHLVELLERGRRSGEFDKRPPVTWQVSAIVGLGHAAGQEVAAGRMPMQDAGAAFRRGALRVCVRSDD